MSGILELVASFSWFCKKGDPEGDRVRLRVIDERQVLGAVLRCSALTPVAQAVLKW